MSRPLSRRSLLELAAASGGLYLAGCASASAAAAPRARGRLRHASIGVGGMGAADLDQIRAHGSVDVLALCDVDANNLSAAAAKVPGARLYRDWRDLLEDESERIDSVNVSTPDHMHAAIALEALRRGKHVYCQKPLTRTVREARAVARAAAKAGVVTQMGNQGHSGSQHSQALQLLRAGHIGRVYEAHVWTDRPAGWWAQGVDRPEGEDPVPDTLAWDLWLGVSPQRPFKKDTYHPFRWRGWKDFGTGAQGDMACHLMDAPVWFLELGTPLRIRSDGPAPNAETFPLWSEVHYEFPPNEHTTRGPLRMTWHDGKRKAPRELLDDLAAGEVFDNGSLFVGEKGAMLVSPYDVPRLLPADRFASVAIPEGASANHWHQWVDACLGKGEASAPFSYAAHLSEIALLGNVALHFPHETLEYDGPRMRFPKRPEADRLLSSPQRKGWEIRGLG
jgi:predicted dehydrogenase